MNPKVKNQILDSSKRVKGKVKKALPSSDISNENALEFKRKNACKRYYDWGNDSNISGFDSHDICISSKKNIQCEDFEDTDYEEVKKSNKSVNTRQMLLKIWMDKRYSIYQINKEN